MSHGAKLPSWAANLVRYPGKPLLSVEPECGGGLLLSRHATPLTRRNVVYFSSGAYNLDALGQELAAHPANHGSPGLRITVGGELRNLHPILRDEIYRIAAEALRNAFRHAQAGLVEVEIRYDDRQFSLRVRDDRIGMDAAVFVMADS